MNESEWKKSSVTRRLSQLARDIAVGDFVGSAILAVKAYDEYKEKWGP